MGSCFPTRPSRALADLQNGSLPILNKAYYGLFTQVDEDRVCFMEGAEKKPRRRNITIFDGKHITMTYSDGFVRLNFKELHLDEDFDKDLFSDSVKIEIGKSSMAS